MTPEETKALDAMALERLIAAYDDFQLAKAVAIAQHIQWRIDSVRNTDESKLTR